MRWHNDGLLWFNKANHEMITGHNRAIKILIKSSAYPIPTPGSTFRTSCSWHPKMNIVSLPGSRGASNFTTAYAPKKIHQQQVIRSSSSSLVAVHFTECQLTPEGFRSLLSKWGHHPLNKTKLPHSSRISMLAPSMVPTIKPPFITNLGSSVESGRPLGSTSCNHSPFASRGTN